MEKNNSPPIPTPIGERIKAMRAERNLLQKEVADIFQVSRRTIIAHERGQSKVAKCWIWCYAIVFRCKPDKITDGTDWEGDSSFY